MVCKERLRGSIPFKLGLQQKARNIDYSPKPLCVIDCRKVSQFMWRSIRNLLRMYRQKTNFCQAGISNTVIQQTALYAAKTTRLEVQDPASYFILFKTTPGGRKKRLYIFCTSLSICCLSSFYKFIGYFISSAFHYFMQKTHQPNDLKFEPHCVQVCSRISQKNSSCWGKCVCVSSMKFHVVFFKSNLHCYWLYQKMSLLSIFCQYSSFTAGWPCTHCAQTVHAEPQEQLIKHNQTKFNSVHFPLPIK